ncbi:MAG: hypothetical protein RIM83_08165 [Allomuricauda sp.]
MENSNVLQLDFGFEMEPTETPRPQSNKKTRSDFGFDFMDVLTGPIIVYPSAWQDLIPVDILQNITSARMLVQMEGKQTASLTEVVAYMMPRTYEAPMPSEWTNIYTWCGLQYVRTFNKTEQLEAMMEIAPEQLSDQEKGLLDNLRSWIYGKRRQALRDKLKTSERPDTKSSRDNQGELF